MQSDSESSSAVDLNSATEISTDSEFERDPVVRETPRTKANENQSKRPTRVQVSLYSYSVRHLIFIFTKILISYS